MSEITLTGKVKLVGEEINVSSSFTKRELVISTEEQYPQHILINFPQGKCNSDLDQLVPGSEVTVSVNIRGREWINPQGEAKYFNDIQGWKVVHVMPAKHVPAAPVQNAAPASNNAAAAEEEDDLLF